VNGLKVHYAEAGTSPLALLLHGFPETWFGWRHQTPARWRRWPPGRTRPSVT